MADVIDFSALFAISEKTLQEVRSMRGEVREVRQLAMQSVEYLRRLERRMEELKDDLEVLIRSEVGGRLAHLQTELEADIARQIEERLEAAFRVLQDLQSQYREVLRLIDTLREQKRT